jgi:hypothetical protein
MENENFQHLWKDLVDSITQHPSTKPYKPLTVREQQLETELRLLRLQISELWQQLVKLTVAMGDVVINADRPDDGDEVII